MGSNNKQIQQKNLKFSFIVIKHLLKLFWHYIYQKVHIGHWERNISLNKYFTFAFSFQVSCQHFYISLIFRDY